MGLPKNLAHYFRRLSCQFHFDIDQNHHSEFELFDLKCWVINVEIVHIKWYYLTVETKKNSQNLS